MTDIIHSNATASISKPKQNPIATISAGAGYAVAILSHSHPVFYCVPAERYGHMLKYIDKKKLDKLINDYTIQTLHKPVSTEIQYCTDIQ